MVHDIRETRVYQEAREEGLQEGIKKGIRETKLKLIPKLAARKMSATEIADVLGLDVQVVRRTMRKKA